MKHKIVAMVLCLSSILFFTSDGLTEDECCCQMTCNYVRALGGSPTTIEVDQCWDLNQISSCSEDTACLKMKTLFITYTNEWSGAGCRIQEKCPLDILYGPDNPKLDILRVFRDEVLSQTPEGNEIIDLYYTLGPVLVEAMEQDEQLKEEVKEIIELYLPMMREDNR